MIRKTVICLVTLFVTISIVSAQYKQEIKVLPLMVTDTTATGQKIYYPEGGKEQVTMCKVIIPPGKSTGWHKHEIPVFAFVEKGTLSVELEGGKVNNFPENSTFAEVVGTYHNGTNKGDSDVVLIAIYLGLKNRPLSIKK
jgi:quercetin dioxygenase-like cupin family protein